MREYAFRAVIVSATLAALFILIVLTVNVFKQGLPWLDQQFLTSFPSRFPERAGIKSAIWGSVWLGGFTLLFSVFFGVGAALYLEELAPKNRINRILEVNISTLAGVPSIIYGMLGLTLFVRIMAFERSVLAGGLTLSLLIMPVIIIATREALKCVPDDIRLGAAALGATKWQAVRDHVLPAAMPGVLTGIILAMARAVGEAAPLIMIGALSYVAFVPESAFDAFTALPIQIFNWTSRPKEEFHALAAAGIIVLLGFLLVCNSIAILLRLKWKDHRR
ncbi:MAG: phosphate ABC transporter permease PstA [Pseudobacteriovorax sp.]|nr:phosphate ABC transporter permease PstA [Pseudobacteriovorax sp.]